MILSTARGPVPVNMAIARHGRDWTFRIRGVTPSKRALQAQTVA